MVKIIFFIVSLFLTTSSLATTCAVNDTDCELNQKKLQLMDKAGIKPVETSDQQPAVAPNVDKKKLPEQVPFQIPKPESSSDQQSGQIKYNPGLKMPENKTDMYR